jgi:glycerol-3-phosphate acyltransferase PlsX
VSKTIRISLDAMGGDDAPDIVVKGADLALAEAPYLKLTLVGDARRIEPLLAQTSHVRDAEIIHCDAAVEAAEKPSAALRRGKDTSMWQAIAQVADGQAEAVVSAGNTGALMAIAKLQLRMVEGVSRPAIAAFLPTMRGQSCVLDLGANIEVDADNLVQFALMGVAFCRDILGIRNPSVGLLNVGEEEQKGFDYLREAARRLSAPQLGINYVGFIEGSDLGGGKTDVIVTDGFTGNIALKTAEGTAQLIQHVLRQSFSSSLAAKLSYLAARPALRRMRDELDPRHHNGAVFLGLNGIAVKSHGGTDRLGFAHAIKVAAGLVEQGFIPEIAETVAAANQVIETLPADES